MSQTKEIFTVTASMANDPDGKLITVYKLHYFVGSGTASEVIGDQAWPTREEATTACVAVNSGDENGLTFGMYSND